MPIAQSSPAVLETLLERNDPRLEPLLRAETEAEAERVIGEVIAREVIPLATRIVRSQAHANTSLGDDDVDDLVALVAMRLMLKLRAARDSADHAVQSVEKYASRLTYNAIHDHYRQRFPERTRLKNRLRYLLTHDPELAHWTAPNGATVCGLARWNGQAAARPQPIEIAAHDDPWETLRAVFRHMAHPLEFDALIDVMAGVWNIGETKTESLDLRSAAPHPPVDAQLEQREILAHLWREIRELRPLQRKALLLNLRDSETAHVLTLLITSGMASFDELAAELELPTNELNAIWDELPLNDQRIAAMLGVTRQQVINLRQAARHRLGRRLSR